MSQSTLSLAMKGIEEETGLNLFRHVGRNIQVTEDGTALWQEVEAMLRHVKRFEADVREIAHRHIRLQIALPAQIATVILPMLLGEFRKLHISIISATISFMEDLLLTVFVCRLATIL